MNKLSKIMEDGRVDLKLLPHCNYIFGRFLRHESTNPVAYEFLCVSFSHSRLNVENLYWGEYHDSGDWEYTSLYQGLIDILNQSIRSGYMIEVSIRDNLNKVKCVDVDGVISK